MGRNLTDILPAAAAEIGVTLEGPQVDLFSRYAEELIRWNAKINLVSDKTLGEIAIRHFVDSLSVLPLLPAGKLRLLDVGSGGGFPGVPLKIVRPSLELYLVEATRKKASFLRHLARDLQLTGVHIINERIEDLLKQEDLHHSFDIICSRATFKLPDLLKYSATLMAPSGIIIALKAKEADREAADAASMAEKLGLKAAERTDLRLPVTGDIRNVLIYRNIL
ncbi:MAG: 16S rRNA (guanine(527)-N(7))-methyltransferase RsmG [Smithellaceae bacterium]|nr:16S rRNA (guanine(527)-N(7))-methyltransferase RsmG [Smithellaceae bacterium]